MRVVTAQQMRDIEERASQAGISLRVVMQHAGTAVADAVRPFGGPVLVLAGPGNNGGDGLIAAERLQDAGIAVTVYTWKRESPSTLALKAVQAEQDSDRSGLRKLIHESKVIVDALLGTGQHRPPEGVLADILKIVNEEGETQFRVAVDIPTGVNADTGAAGSSAFAADRTICMALPKIGEVVYPGAGYAGQIEVVDVGLPIPDDFEADVRMPEAADIARILPRRGADSNKGTFGRVIYSGGSQNFLGAPVLSSMASYRAGAGLVELAVIDPVQRTVATHSSEVIFQTLREHEGHISQDAASAIAEAWQRADAFVFGPGMGLTEGTVELTRRLLEKLPDAQLHGTVIDADGLNALSRIEGWWQHHAPLVITPHPGEMSRLTGLKIAEIQSNRLAVACDHAAKWGVVVVLKGAATVVASPAGKMSINPTGGPNLATAGTGDVLSGIIGGLLAQGCEPFDAAVAGAYLHGRAGDLVAERLGDAGTVAGDLLSVIPEARRSIIREARERG